MREMNEMREFRGGRLREEAIWLKSNDRKMREEEGLKRFNLRWSLAATLKMSPLILQMTPFGLMIKILGREFKAPNFQNYMSPLISTF